MGGKAGHYCSEFSFTNMTDSTSVLHSSSKFLYSIPQFQ